MDAAVVGLPSGRGDEEVVAVVVLEPGTTLDQDAVRSGCREHVAAYKVPRRVYAVDALPVSVIGKVLRRQVRDDLQARLDQTASPT